ncbi:MAG: hypothetical protein F6K47_39820 [Symploca sp. SIO2E6]|nr:hypothetical protein [Symploca sp. SIO2E6]
MGHRLIVINFMFSNNKTYDSHHYADYFPMMQKDELKSLIDDIRQHGLHEEIWLYQGLILDGRNRYQACLSANVEPRFREFDGNDEDALNAVISWNMERRHLTQSQKAAIAVELLPEFEEIAREKLREVGRKYGENHPKEPEALVPQALDEKKRDPQARNYVAKAMGVGSRYVQGAKRIKETDPNLYQDVKAGKISVKRAERQVAKAKAQANAEQLENTAQAVIEERVEVSLGDVWKLGRHTLHCCDSSQWSPSDKAKMVFADPPYNGGVADWDRGFQWQHDWLEEYADYVFVTPGTANLANFLGSTKMRYRWQYTHWLCNAIASPNDWGMSNLIHALLFSKLDALRLEKRVDFHKAIINPMENNITQHPGRKPTSLLLWLMDMVTQEDDVVIDPFLGSGTTLLVAENLNRVCHGAEISPEYCQETISRWQSLKPKGDLKKLN